MILNAAKLRASTNKTIRRFFDSRGFLEVETPLLSPDLIPEAHIDFFSTLYRHPRRDDRPLYLLPSPELWMKKLLSQGSGSIFQISRCFRNSEQTSPCHNPEFTMLEWYETDADYEDSIKTTQDLFSRLEGPGAEESWRRDFRIITMEEAFKEFMGENILPWCLPGDDGYQLLREACRVRGHEVQENLERKEEWEELFNLLFLNYVEPRLPVDRPVILKDYPARISSLAQETACGPWLERWELYIKGMEIANCYTEERGPEKVKRFFDGEQPKQAEAARLLNIPPPACDKDYYRHFHKDFPRCSGVALGLDRLLMLLGNTSSLGGVIFFPFSAIL